LLATQSGELVAAESPQSEATQVAPPYVVHDIHPEVRIHFGLIDLTSLEPQILPVCRPAVGLHLDDATVRGLNVGWRALASPVCRRPALGLSYAITKSIAAFR
jgi:hypothetical protein